MMLSWIRDHVVSVFPLLITNQLLDYIVLIEDIIHSQAQTWVDKMSPTAEEGIQVELTGRPPRLSLFYSSRIGNSILVTSIVV